MIRWVPVSYTHLWKKQGEDYYREQIESLQRGRDVFVPYLEQHKTLTPDDEKLYAEIMATESDWFAPAEGEKQTPHYTCLLYTSTEKCQSRLRRNAYLGLCW